MIRAAALLAALPLLASPHEAEPEGALPRPLAMTGVNLAGGEFGAEGKTDLVPGRDYIYPDAAIAAPFRAAGMTAVRVPVRWENLQRAPLALLDAAEMARVDAAVAALAGFRWIVLDIHNYARFQGVRLDGGERSRALLANLWSQLARRYRGNPRVAFGLMNEPVEIGARAWRSVAEESLRAIRATGARNLVLVPGTRWTGAHSWSEGGADSNAAAFAGFRDPSGGPIAIELHQYLDGNSSGTSPDCVAPAVAVDRLRVATGWLRANHLRGVLGEFGGGPGAGCLASIDAMLRHLERNADAWMGWTAWAGGAWWGGNPFSLQPSADGAAKPQMRVLARHVAR